MKTEPLKLKPIIQDLFREWVITPTAYSLNSPIWIKLKLEKSDSCLILNDCYLSDVLPPIKAQ